MSSCRDERFETGRVLMPAELTEDRPDPECPEALADPEAPAGPEVLAALAVPGGLRARHRRGCCFMRRQSR